MSEAPVEVARRANDLFASIPFETLREAVLEAKDYEAAANRFEQLGLGSLDDLIDEDIEVEIGGFEGGGALAGGGGRGREAWLRFWQEWLEPWEELAFEPSSYEDAGQDGEHVLVNATVTARGRLSGAPVELDVWQVWTVHDGRVVHYAVHPTRESALTAVSNGESE